MRGLTIALLLLTVGCLPPDVSPGPKPDDDIVKPVVSAATAEFLHQYRSGLKSAWKEAAGKSFDNEVEANTWLQERTGGARREAAMILNRDMEKQIGGDKWSLEKFRQYAKQQEAAL